MEFPDLNVLAIDDEWLAVDKPSGLLSVPGKAPNFDSVLLRVRTQIPDAEAPHRLDMDTSGVLLVARHKQGMRFLSRGFARRLGSKRYVAVVAGIVADDEGVIDYPLARDWDNRPRQHVHPEGKPSETHFRVTWRDEAASLTHVVLTPVTGRTHQLRVHMMAAGHPILGDLLYGGEHTARSPRLLLHAHRLTFPTPPDETPRTIEAPIPFPFHDVDAR